MKLSVLKDALVIPNKIGTGIDFNKETIKKYEYKY